MKKRHYVGYANGGRWLFTSAAEPTTETHGHVYAAVIGPFRTKRGAEYMLAHGENNPHCLTVADAERLAPRKPRRLQGGKKTGPEGFSSFG
jgi:hypothetical protein